MPEHRPARIFLLICLAFLLYFLFQIFRPFLLPLVLATILTSLSYPLFEYIAGLLKGRRGWAALLTCIGIMVLIVVPFVVLLVLLAGEVNQVYRQFQRSLQAGGFEKLDPRNYPYFGPVWNWLNHYVPLDQFDLIGSFAKVAEQVSLFFLRRSTAIVSGLFGLVMNFSIMVFAMFFLFRDGPRLLQEVKSWTPLSASDETRLVEKFRDVANATVLGNLLTALAQGLAGGLVFLVLGISNPLLWAFLIALLSLVPVVGPALVWVPWALYFFSIGSNWRAIVLALLMSLLVGSIDNFLRPMLIEGKTKMHTLVVFLSIMGGIAYFGMLGVLFGPIIVAIALTFVELYKLEFQDELSKTAR